MGKLTTVIKVNGRDRDTFLADPDFIYVGRMFAGFKASPFGNPFKAGMRRSRAVALLGRDIASTPRADSLDGRLAVAFFRQWLIADPALMAKLPELNGRVLGCWCGNWSPGGPDLACHAVVLAKLANSLEES